MEIQFGYYPHVIPLVLARVAAVLFSVPFFGGDQIDSKLKAAIAIVVTMILLPVVPAEWVEIARRIHTLPELLLAVLNEVMLGMAVGLICHIFQAVCEVAGALQGRSAALRMAQALDPLSGASAPIMSAALQALFVLIVLLNDGHLVLLRLVSASFTTAAHPAQWMGGDFFGLIMSLGSIIFDWGLRIAMPMVSASLILHVCMGLIARLAPDFNVLFLSLPFKLGIGIFLFGLVLRFSNEVFNRLIERMLLSCANVLGV